MRHGSEAVPKEVLLADEGRGATDEFDLGAILRQRRLHYPPSGRQSLQRLEVLLHVVVLVVASAF
jgi:hypothetical protein